MLLPALLLLLRQAFRPVACTPAEDQLLQAYIVKARAVHAQLLGRQLAQLVQPAAVGRADEAVVQVLIHIIRPMAFELAVHLLPQLAHVWQRAGLDGMLNAQIHVNAPLACHFRRQRLEVAHHHRRLVDVNALDGQTRHPLWQICRPGEHAQAQCVRINGSQLAGICIQVPADHLVLVGRVLGQWPHHSNASTLGPDHAGDMQKRPCVDLLCRQPHLMQHTVFFAQRKGKLKQLGVLLLDQPCQRNRGAHIAQGIMGLLMPQAVGARQVFELERRAAIFLDRPLNAIRAQRIDHAHHIQQIPAAAVVLPLARIGIDQIAPEQKTRHLIVKANRVVAHAHRARLAEGRLNLTRKHVFWHALLQRLLRGNAGDQAGLGAGQIVRRRLAVQHDGLAHLVEVHVGANRRKLRGTVITRIGTKGFVVVPEEGKFSHEGCSLSTCRQRKCSYDRKIADSSPVF